MENSHLITVASIEECKELLINIEENLEPQTECCIYKVPKDLRRINEDAYTPQVISIGPLHHGNNELVDMEKQKIRYKREFVKRITTETWQQLISFMEIHEQYIRNCYQEMPKFQKLDFVAMILYDAIFIMELFLRHHERKNDFLLNNARLRAIICLDLQLLENQLPYFILNGLYMLTFPKPNPHEQSYPSLFFLSCMFIYDIMFRDITNKLKAHYKNPWNHAIATLKRVYFSNYWRGTGTVAAIVLLLLTLIQTVCSIFQVM